MWLAQQETPENNRDDRLCVDDWGNNTGWQGDESNRNEMLTYRECAPGSHKLQPVGSQVDIGRRPAKRDRGQRQRHEGECKYNEPAGWHA